MFIPPAGHSVFLLVLVLRFFFFFRYILHIKHKSQICNSMSLKNSNTCLNDTFIKINVFSTQKLPSLLLLSSQFPILPRGKQHRLVFHILGLHKNEIIWNVLFFFLHSLLSILLCQQFVLLLLIVILLCEYTTIRLSILLLMDICAFLKIWAIINKAAMNLLVQGFLCLFVFFSPGRTPGSGIAESWDRCMFNFVRNCQVSFQSDDHFALPPVMVETCVCSTS